MQKVGTDTAHQHKQPWFGLLDGRKEVTTLPTAATTLASANRNGAITILDRPWGLSEHWVSWDALTAESVLPWDEGER